MHICVENPHNIHTGNIKFLFHYFVFCVEQKHLETLLSA